MQFQAREIVILLIVSAMALAANLPGAVVSMFVDQKLLLVTLAITVTISLFRYLKLVLFLSVSILAIGANLPEQMAERLGFNPHIMIVASGVLVFMALLYKLNQSRLFASPTRAEAVREDQHPHQHDTLDSRQEVLSAILKGNLATLHQLIIAGVNINFSQNGLIPLFLSIQRGYADIVLMLLSHGAKLRIRNSDGLTPLQYALLQKDMRIAELVHYASKGCLLAQHETEDTAQESGKVAILFADICGSSALYEKLGDTAALFLVTRTLNLLAQQVVAHKGSLVKTIGDEIMCSFPSAALAARAAGAMHAAVDAQRPGGEPPLSIRIGFHFGEVIRRHNDVFGDTVNVAARITAVTRARQILTSQAVVDELPSANLKQIRPVMRSAFRGKQESFAVFQVLWESDSTLMQRMGELGSRKPHEDGAVSHMAQASATRSNYAGYGAEAPLLQNS